MIKFMQKRSKFHRESAEIRVNASIDQVPLIMSPSGKSLKWTSGSRNGTQSVTGSVIMSPLRLPRPDDRVTNKASEENVVLQYSPLETLEIMNFCILQTMLYLAMDSHQLRQFMAQEMIDHLSSIMNVTNVLCPRPNVEVEEVVTSRSVGLYDSEPTLKTHNDFPVQKKKGIFASIFRSRKKESLPTSVREDIPLESLLKPSKPTQDLDNVVRSNQIPFKNYGPSRYGMSEASWRLLILTRRCLEDLVTILDIQIRFAEQYPIEDEPQVPTRDFTRDPGTPHGGRTMRPPLSPAENSPPERGNLASSYETPSNGPGIAEGGALSIDVGPDFGALPRSPGRSGGLSKFKRGGESPKLGRSAPKDKTPAPVLAGREANALSSSFQVKGAGAGAKPGLLPGRAFNPSIGKMRERKGLVRKTG